MTNYNIAEEIEMLKNVIISLQWFIIIIFITWFASHLTIITQLPKIKRLLEKICYEGEEEEEN